MPGPSNFLAERGDRATDLGLEIDRGRRSLRLGKAPERGPSYLATHSVFPLDESDGLDLLEGTERAAGHRSTGCNHQ